MDREALERDIAQTLRAQARALCARCLTELVGGAHGAQNVDVRVVVVHFGLLADEFAFGSACARCGSSEPIGNPVLRLGSLREGSEPG